MNAPGRFVAPEDVKTVATLLKRSESILESQVRGHSMGPTLPDGVHVRIQCGTRRVRQPGAVVTFLTEPGLVTHRVVACRGDHVLTRGDATGACDPPVPLDCVLGTVDAWRLGNNWLPVPGPPRRSLAGRFGSALSLFAVLAALAVHPRLAKRVAVWGFRFRDRFVPSTAHES
jgi:hypothetical protein